GDVLLRLNEPFTSVCIQKHQAGILIPSYFVSIKITNKNFLPAYVRWYLNTNNVKREFYPSQSRTLTPKIKQKIIRELKIPNLAMNEQERITQVHDLYLKERRLLTDLMKEKDQYFKAVTNKIIQENMED